ncbi:MAG: DUF3307 domain-containing protein [Chloroflexia bacterium]|nr:DUF3307 domain-containing protein [Chloroflexia bacterium]
MHQDTAPPYCWLLLAHLLGDWVLQNDWMANGKKRGLFTLAGLVHYSIYTTAILLGLWLGGVRARGPAFYLAIGGATFVSHWLLDGTDAVERWMRFFRQSHTDCRGISRAFGESPGPKRDTFPGGNCSDLDGGAVPE